MNFVYDQLYDGRKIRIFTVIDAFTRYVPAIEVRERFAGADVAAHRFLSLADARRKCERWRRDYNDVRPHGAIGYETPAAQAKRSSAMSPP